MVQIRDHLVLLDGQQKLQWLWQGASISQIANWSEIFLFPSLTGKQFTFVCAKKIVPSKLKMILKRVLRLRN